MADKDKGIAMPKEIIQFPYGNYDLRSLSQSCTELTVHWSKGSDVYDHTVGFVQLAATRHQFKPAEKTAHGELEPLTSNGHQHGDHWNCDECKQTVEWQDEQKKSGKAEMFSHHTPSDAPPVGEFHPPSTVFTDELNRDQINTLIRVLRRARDQAFGPDA